MSSGAPRKIEGIKLKKVWVRAQEKMKRENPRGSKGRREEKERRKTARVLGWIPGTRPVKHPARIPRKTSIIPFHDNFELSFIAFDYPLDAGRTRPYSIQTKSNNPDLACPIPELTEPVFTAIST